MIPRRIVFLSMTAWLFFVITSSNIESSVVTAHQHDGCSSWSYEMELLFYKEYAITDRRAASLFNEISSSYNNEQYIHDLLYFSEYIKKTRGNWVLLQRLNHNSGMLLSALFIEDAGGEWSVVSRGKFNGKRYSESRLLNKSESEFLKKSIYSARSNKDLINVNYYYTNHADASYITIGRGCNYLRRRAVYFPYYLNIKNNSHMDESYVYLAREANKLLKMAGYLF